MQDTNKFYLQNPTPPSMHYVYVMIWLSSRNFYIGYSNDLVRRMKEHSKEGKCKLLYYEAYLYEKSAKIREKKLKQYGSAWRAIKKRIGA